MKDLEALTQDYGKDIFARLSSDGPLPLSPSWFDDQLMDWTMSDPTIKVQLFRFIDVLPMLRTPAAVVRHLREYFGEVSDRLPWWLRLGLRWLPERGWLDRWIAALAGRNAERLAHRFIAGSSIPEALDVLVEMRRRSLAFTVDLLGEATITEVEADQAQKEYLALIAGLSEQINTWPAVPLIDSDDRGELPRVNVSVKLSALYSQFDPIDPDGATRAVAARLRPILRTAQWSHAFVNIDMEQYEVKDLTLHVFRTVLEEEEFRDWPDVGIAVQAYLRDTEEDLRHLAEWAERRGCPVGVRLVKGAYWDHETIVAAQEGWPTPVFTRKHESDANYEQLTRWLLEQRDRLRPAFGSHNVRSLAHALAAADRLGLPDNGYEIQMLYGMADPIKAALVSMGRRVRVYTPYGQLLPGMAYLVRRLLENTANESFLRASFREGVPEEQLLMNPVKHATNGKPAALVQPPGDEFRNEPLTDFGQAEARAAMQQALSQVAGQFGKTYPPVLGGETHPADNVADAVNPSHTRQVIGRYARANEGQAKWAVEVAKRAFPAWRDTPVEERARYLFRAAEVMRRRRLELAAWQLYECGKQWRECDADVAEGIDFCEYYARQMQRLAKPLRRDVPGEDNEYFFEARGVTVVIAPWNFPLAILTGMTAAALVAGNTVIMKPAEQSAVTGAKLMEVFQEAGLPPGVVNFLPGVGEEVGPVLVNHPDVAVIAFTGSQNVGLWINRQAAEVPPGQDHIKRVIAELGGKNAVIIDEDADLDLAVDGVVYSAFGYQGQKCSACSRVIVLESLYDSFLSRLIEATRSLTIAPAEDPGSTVGPVIDADAQRRILGAIEEGKREGRLVYGGDVGALAGEGHYVAPHIFADVPPSARLAQEEIFGPVLAVLKARDLTEALAIANGTRYALTGGVFSRSPQTLARARREFRVGNLYLNRKITGALVDRQPFGGFKMSGIGSKAGGPDYLLQFLLPRTITENTVRRGFAPAADD